MFKLLVLIKKIIQVHNMLDYVELEIGGQRIDKHYGHWMEVWAELTEPNETGHAAATALLGGNHH